MIQVFKIAGERSNAKKYCPASLPSVVSKVFEKFVNNRLDDHIKNCCSFLYQYGFRSSRSTADLLKVVSELLGILIGQGLLSL